MYILNELTAYYNANSNIPLKACKQALLING
jgi:hypothetical protein